MHHSFLTKIRLKLTKNDYGITLAETLIGMIISMFILAAIYQMYIIQQKLYVTQQQISETQQRLRGIMDLMVKEMQMAGYDPLETAKSGFVVNFQTPNDIFEPDIDYSVDTNIIAFTVDNNEDGSIDIDDNEQIAYRVSNHTLERYMASLDTWIALAGNIDVLDFVFLDAAGDVTNNLANIRNVEITLLARTKTVDSKYTNSRTYENNQSQVIFTPDEHDHYRRRILTARVQCRNLGL